MDYLKHYNLSSDDIKQIERELDPLQISEFSIHRERVQNVIEYFISIGFLNIKELFIYFPSILYMNVDYLKGKVRAKNDIVARINDNIMNLSYFEE